MPDDQADARARYDLHLHTCWSYDATAGVEELFDAAVQAGVRCIAVTDHHVVDGLGEARAAAAAHPDVVYVPGAELTVTASIGAVDMVCLGFSEAAIAALAPVWQAYHEWQREYGTATTAGMRALGFDYTDAQREELLASYRPARTIAVQGATHVSNKHQRAWFIERGFINSDEEYGPVLAAAGQEVARPPYPSAEFALPAVTAHGALVVIAHPTGYFQRDNAERMDLLREELLLDGIECAHGGVPPELTPVYRAYCERHGLLSTGGSDLHWSGSAREGIGRHLGPDKWWDEIAARLPAGVPVNA